MLYVWFHKFDTANLITKQYNEIGNIFNLHILKLMKFTCKHKTEWISKTILNKNRLANKQTKKTKNIIGSHYLTSNYTTRAIVTNTACYWYLSQIGESGK